MRNFVVDIVGIIIFTILFGGAIHNGGYDIAFFDFCGIFLFAVWAWIDWDHSAEGG